MIEQIGQIIATKIKACGLVWTDKVFGVVNPVTYEKGDKTITEANLCNQDIQECTPFNIVVAEPNSSDNSLIFIQPFEPEWKTDRSCQIEEYTAKIEIYVWINKRNVQADGLTTCDDEFVFKQQLINCLNGFTHKSTEYPNFFDLCHIKTSPGSLVSKNYTFSETKKKLLDQTNHEFVLTFESVIRVNHSCLNVTVSIIDPNCLDPTLLELFPGAKSAHSVARLLNKSYLGDAFTVRRASDDTELNIGFLNNKTRVADAVTFCAGTDGFVSKVFDQSGNSFDLTAGSNSAQPKIISNGSLIVDSNGVIVARFDGVDDTLNALYGGSLTNPTTNFTTWVSGNVDAALASVFFTLNIGSAHAPSLIDRGTNLAAIYQSGAFFGPNAAIANSSAFLSTLLSSTVGTNWRHRQNGAELINSGENIGTSTPNEISIGERGNASAFNNLDWQETVIYESDQSVNFVGIETNINDFYNIF